MPATVLSYETREGEEGIAEVKIRLNA